MHNKRIDILSASEAGVYWEAGWESYVTTVTRGGEMPKRFRVVGSTLDGRVETQGRLGSTRTEGMKAKGADTPKVEAAMGRRKILGSIERRRARLSERRGSAKNSLVGQATNAVRGSVIRLLIKLLKGKLFTPTLEIAEDRTHQNF